jgi:hypothetical protein
MTADEREEYQGILEDLKEQRALLRAALKAAIPNSEIQTYSLTDTEGGQSATRRDPEAIMKQLESLNRQISYYSRLIANRPTVFNPRRW